MQTKTSEFSNAEKEFIGLIVDLHDNFDTIKSLVSHGQKLVDNDAEPARVSQLLAEVGRITDDAREQVSATGLYWKNRVA